MLFGLLGGRNNKTKDLVCRSSKRRKENSVKEKSEGRCERYSRKSVGVQSDSTHTGYRMRYIIFRIVSVGMAVLALVVGFGKVYEVSSFDHFDNLMLRLFGEDGLRNNGLPELLIRQNFASGFAKLFEHDENDSAKGEEGKQEQPGISGESNGAAPDNVTQQPDLPSVPSQNSGGNGGGTDAPSVSGGIYDFDYSKVPEGMTPIIPMDLSLSNLGSKYIHNDTSYSISVPALLNYDSVPDFDYGNSAVYPKGEPVVLIVHTHGTEGYSESGALGFFDNGGEIARSDNTDENVVAVGKKISALLNERGVVTYHCPIMHDADSYKDSYKRSAETISKYLAEYPSIQYVIDIHRDSVMKSTGELVRPVTVVDGKPCAQVMFVVGSDFNGTYNPEWKNNLSIALKLREMLNSKEKSFCRPVCLRGSSYNQEMAYRSLLIEVGASGNSLVEALNSAEYIAEALADLIIK